MLTVFFFLFGFAITAIGIVWFVSAAKRLWRVVRTPTTPIAKAPDNGIFEIKGRLRAGPGGTVRAPLSGSNVVWIRVLVSGSRESRDSSERPTREPIDLVVANTDAWFLVDDGSGELARIEPARAEITVLKKKRQRGISEDVARFIGERGIAMPDPARGPFTVEESVLSEGAPIYVLGPVTREPKPDATGVANRLVFERGLAGQGLLVTEESETMVVAGQIVGMVVSAILMGAGLWLFAQTFSAAR